MRSKPLVDHGTVKVLGDTLQGALAGVRERYGDGAMIVGTRTVGRRSSDGLGRTEQIEVEVVLPGTAQRRQAAARNAAETVEELCSEIERIETLVTEITGRAEAAAPPPPSTSTHPFARQLLAGGASRAAVDHLSRLFLAEANGQDHRAALEHLRSRLQVARRDDELAGVHILLGAPGSGRTELCLNLAAAERARGRRVLLLLLAPRHGGEVKRLQDAAVAAGYDAAVVHETDRFERCLDHVADYDLVLVDTPALGTSAMTGPRLRGVVAGRDDLHRHLVLPLDGDLDSRARLWEQGREWSADWLALTRGDLAGRPCRLLDVLLSAPLPVGLVAQGGCPDGHVLRPSQRDLVGLVLGATVSPDGVAFRQEEG